MTAGPLGRDGFAALTGVSRETLDRLTAYAALLEKWQSTINLVGASTLPDLWRRHMLDSAQLARHAPLNGRWLDLGSGAGFPGLVLAILGAADMHLVESDARKCSFLREAARLTGAHVTIWAKRIEAVPPLAVQVVTARALAPVEKLLAWAAPHRDARTIHLFPKGRDADAELTALASRETLVVERHASASDPAATILVLRVKNHD